MSGANITEAGVVGRMMTLIAESPASHSSGMVFEVESNSPSEEHGWLGAVPGLSRWTGAGDERELREESFTIVNDEYVTDIPVIDKFFRRDKWGQIDAKAQQLIARAGTFYNSQVSSLINLGHSTACYDGQFFYDTDHVSGDSAPQSNDLTVDISALPASVSGSTTAPSAEEMELVILKGVETILGFLDDAGELANEGVSRFNVAVPINMMGPAAKAINSMTFANGQTNALKDLDVNGARVEFALWANARLTATDTIFVTATDQPGGRAFIRQNEMPLLPSVVDDRPKRRRLLRVEWAGAHGYGLWSQSCRLQLV